MRQITVTEFKSELQTLADQHGRARFDAAKSAYMASVSVTDDAGKPLNINDLEIEVEFPEPVKSEPVAAAKSIAIDSDALARIVDGAITKAMGTNRGNAITKAVSATRIEVPSYPTRHFKSSEDAFKAGRWLQAVSGNEAAKSYCLQNGVMNRKAMSEGDNSLGGFGVPEFFDTEIIRLRNTFGVFPQAARMTTMTSDVTYRLRVNDALSVSFVGEAQAASESNPTFTRVDLVAKKLGCFTYISKELSEDAAINMADVFVEEAALAIAKRVDQCGFIGDGSATYGGFVGVTGKLLGLSGTIANIAGLQVATGAGYATSNAATTKLDFARTVGRCPEYALNSGRARWYMSTSYYYGTYLPLISGQVTNYAELLNGAPVMRCEGYPVTFTEVMPANTNPAVSQINALFGDLALAADYGERRGTEVLISPHETTAFLNDQNAARVLSRVAVNVHDVGNASGTVASRIAGPIVGLISASS